jgi:hypothetical protein
MKLPANRSRRHEVSRVLHFRMQMPETGAGAPHKLRIS